MCVVFVVGMNGGSMQHGVRGPFTPSQWMELEHQALIYKYITANVPIPSYLLNPIRKAFEVVGFSSLRSNPCKLPFSLLSWLLFVSVVNV